MRFYLQSVVAHVDNVTEETTIDVLDDRAGADLARVGVLRLAHPLRSDLSIPFSSMKMMTSSHLVFRVDEGVIDALGAVAEVEDGVDLLSTVERLGGSNLTHALRRDIFIICLCQNISTLIVYLEFQLGENHAAGGHTVDVDFLIPEHFGLFHSN